jgi:DNA-binding MarR family transcriptional regulator
MSIHIKSVHRMKLENEIKQKKFRSEEQKLAVNLLFTGNWMQGKQAEILKPFGLTLQQYNILRILKGQHPNPATVNLLIERMLDKMSNASRIVDKLLNKKLITREICPDDRRAVDVKITQQGLELLKKIEVAEVKTEKSLFGINSKEIKFLNNLLNKLRK